MNKQIQLIEKQASDYYWSLEDVDRTADAYTQKFAELLIGKCMSAVGDGPMERPAIQRIKAAFDVEYYEPIGKAFEGSV